MTVKVKATGHNFEVLSQKDPTCSAKGSKTEKCTVCGFEHTVEIDCLPHTFETIEDVDSTCLEAGYTINKCKVCGEEVRTDKELASHKYGEWIEKVKATDEHDGEYGSKPYSPYVPDVSATNIYTFEFDSWDKTIESVAGDCDYTAKYNVVREELDSLEGLKISFLGDSITTFYKEGSEYNNIYPDGYRGLNNCLSQSEAINNYYPSHSDTVKTWDQTWWGQLLVSTKMELGIVNALSGSMAYDHYNYENGVVAMQDSRVSTLDDNGVPDIVVVFIGTNDICSSQPSWYGKSEYTTALNTIYEKIHKFCSPYTDVFFVQMYLSKSASSYKARVDMYN